MTAKPVSIREVAERAGVSLGTVSNVLNRPETVAKSTRQAVLSAIDELKYVRNASASRLRAKKSTVMGVLVVDLANPFIADLIEGTEKALSERGYSAIVSGTGFDLRQLEGRLQLMEEYRVAGVVLPPVYLAEVGPRVDRMRSRGMSFVYFSSDSAINACAADIDQVRGGRMAGEHLLEIGRRRIVYVGGPRDLPYSAMRLAGLRDALAGRKDVCLEVVRIPALTGMDGFAATEAILAHDPDGVFCANDLSALGVLRGLLEHDLRVPADISLVGYDDISFAEIAAVPLTTIRQPARAIGAAAAELLVQEANEPEHVHRQVAFAPELIVRRSSDPSARGTTR